MTQAPDREREQLLAPGVTRRPAGQEPPRQRASWGKVVMVLNVALIGVVAIVGLTILRDAESAPDESTTGQPSGVASTLVDPSDPGPDPGGPAPEPLPPVSEPPVSDPQLPPTGTTEPAPDVKVRMRSDFAGGDAWPVGAGFREAGALAWPLGVVDRLMTHGPAEGPNAVSWLEKWMKTDVRTIGARVLFAPNHSGSAALTAWHTSILGLDGQQTPRTGMRLVVAPGGWRLVVIDARGAETIATGTYAMEGRSATFTLVRKDDTVWVTDPSGTTAVTDPRVATLSGPWASWELREANASKRPAGFQEIWAG